MEFKSFDEMLREQLNRYRGLTDPYIMNLPDFVKTLSETLQSDTLDKDDRKNICTVLGYFVAPLDLIPEEIYGPAGYVDDIFLCALMLKKLVAKHGESFVSGYWNGEEDFSAAIDDAYRKASDNIDRQNLKIKVLDFIGFTE
jgi:uncharacterized membrane protein YkvA (DUF1232 family)